MSPLELRKSIARTISCHACNSNWNPRGGGGGMEGRGVGVSTNNMYPLDLTNWILGIK